MIRNLIFKEPARIQFDALSKTQKDEAGSVLLDVAQQAKKHGVSRTGGQKPLTVAYDVYPDTVVVTDIRVVPSPSAARPADARQPYQGMEMRHRGGGSWIHLNPHEE